MTTGRINQGASCVRSLAWSDTRPLSVDERAALARQEPACVVIAAGLASRSATLRV